MYFKFAKIVYELYLAVMNSKTVLNYFSAESTVEHYAQATARIGLWVSEEKLFTRLFEKKDSILELGCGVGRIAIGLHELEYSNIFATDYSKAMIQRARHISKVLEYPIPFRVCDATDLEFEDDVFDGAIFGFNGLMQIPQAERREQALQEIFRVIRSGAWFVFTTHDRNNSRTQKFWEAEAIRWESKRPDDLDDFGDRIEKTIDGYHFMHVPVVAEMKVMLENVGFRVEAHILRSEIANEPQVVRDFSDDCIFWIVQKPPVHS